MGGWKTWAAVGGLCLLGLALIGMGLLATELQEMLFGLGLQAILFGFGLVGLGHKIERKTAVGTIAAAALAAIQAKNNGTDDSPGAAG